MVRNFKTSVILAAITGKISSDDVNELYELHRFVFNYETFPSVEQINTCWDEMKEHIFKLYPQLDGATYNPQLETSTEAWQQSQKILHGSELPVCRIGETLSDVPQTKKRLLYYNLCRLYDESWQGYPVRQFEFIDIMTGGVVILGECYLNEGIARIMGGIYYKDIAEAAKDYDVLWLLSDEKICRVAETVEGPQAEYRRMINEGVTPEQVNQAMLVLFNVAKKAV